MAEEDEFSLELEIKGKPVVVKGHLRKSAFTYQFLFQLGDAELIVEKDDHGELRAFAPGVIAGGPSPDQQLVKAIVAEMEKLLA